MGARIHGASVVLERQKKRKNPERCGNVKGAPRDFSRKGTNGHLEVGGVKFCRGNPKIRSTKKVSKLYFKSKGQRSFFQFENEKRNSGTWEKKRQGTKIYDTLRRPWRSIERGRSKGGNRGTMSKIERAWNSLEMPQGCKARTAYKLA